MKVADKIACALSLIVFWSIYIYAVLTAFTIPILTVGGFLVLALLIVGGIVLILGSIVLIAIIGD